MPNSQKSLLPSIGDILSSPTIRGLAQHLRPGALYATATSVLNDVATEARNAASERRMPDIAELAEKIVARLRLVEEIPGRPTINATGILFHPEFGGPPMATLAIEQMVKNLREGGDGGGETEETALVPLSLEDTELATPLPKSPLRVLLAELTGAADALVFNSHAGALATLFDALGQPDELRQNIILSASDVYERMDGSRLLDSADPRVISTTTVGSINRTTIDDYEKALKFEERGIIFCTDSTNDCFQYQKHVPELSKLVELAGKYNAPLVFDSEWGTFHETAGFVSAKIPVIKDLLKQGVTAVVFSTGGLNGGPRLTMITGEKNLLNKIKLSRLGAAYAPTSYDLAALETTLAILITRDRAEMEIPICELVSTSSDNLKLRAQRIAAQLAAVAEVAASQEKFETVPLTPLRDNLKLPSWAVELTLQTKTAQEVSQQLRVSKPSVAVSSLPENPNKMTLHLRTVFARQDISLIETLQKVLNSGKNQ